MTAHVRLCRLLLAAAASALALAMPGAAAELNPAALAYKLPDQIKWNPPSAAGSQNSVLVTPGIARANADAAAASSRRHSLT